MLPAPRFTATAVLALIWLVVLPIPSWPLVFCPQHLMLPAVVSMQVNWYPRATEEAAMPAASI